METGRNQRGPGRREIWAGHVAAWRSSGLTVREFCTNRRLAACSFYAWRKRLRTTEAGPRRRPGPGTRFVPLQVVGLPAEALAKVGGARALVELELAGGRVLKFPAEMAPEMVARLAAALET